MSADSVKRRVRIVDCELWTADLVRTADCRLRTGGKMQTANYRLFHSAVLPFPSMKANRKQGVSLQGWVVQKSVNANPRLNLFFSCLKMFFTSKIG